MVDAYGLLRRRRLGLQAALRLIQRGWIMILDRWLGRPTDIAIALVEASSQPF